MNRRGFIGNTAKLGAGSVLTAYLPTPVLAVAEDARRLLWYSSHCYCCGFPYCPEWLAKQNPMPVNLLCEWCKWHRGHVETMTVPDDWYPGLYEDPTAKPYL